LAEFRNGSLQQLQTLLHLRREDLLLGDSRDEFHTSHFFRGTPTALKSKQLLGQLPIKTLLL
jgi:hypothetical protein